MIREKREERGLPPREISKKNIKMMPSVVSGSMASIGHKNQDD
jgi:hypothetical protein